MKEVKTPKKPLIYYYGIVLLVLIVFNLVVSPILMEHQVEETDYGTFMSMINDKNIGNRFEAGKTFKGGYDIEAF